MMMVLMFGSAFAAEPKWELNLSTNNLAGIEKSLDNVGADDFSTIGLEAGYSVLPWFSLLTGWEYGAIQTRYDTGSGAYENYDDGYLESQLDCHQIHLGTRFQAKISNRIYGYTQLEGLMGLSSLRFAGDIAEEDPLSETKGSASSIGGIASLGVMYRSKPLMQRLQLQAHLELGYEHQTSFAFTENIGSVQIRGIHSSLGVGIRF